MNEYDVVVVGGRVAGASTALLLARAGVRVVLVDRDRYGSDTLSTLALTRGGVVQLARWGVLPDVAAAGTPPIRQVVFCYADGEQVSVAIKPSAGVEALYAPRRYLLDRLLVDAAAAAGAEVLHETIATALLLTPAGRVAGVRIRSRNGRSADLHAPLTVGADGIRSTVARQVAASVTHTGVNASAFLYRYFDQLPAAGCEWAYGDHAAAGLSPTNDATCVFVSTTPTRLRPYAAPGLNRRSTSCSRRRLPPSSTGSRLAPRRARCAASLVGLITCAKVGDLAGRWSATPATSKTQSPRTG